MILKNFYKGRKKIKRNFIYITLFLSLTHNLISFDLSSIRWASPIPISSLNSSADDYAPNFNYYEHLLYFSSSKNGNTYFYTSKYENKNFDAPILVKSSINKTAKHQNYISFFSPELSYFSSFKSTEFFPVLNIFKSYFLKNSWTEGIADDTLNIGESNAQLTISPDKSTAIFISNKNNKNYDTDLWMIQKNVDGDWSIPVKLDEINTQSREITPFLKSSDTLFFASDGFGGPGGFDIYFSIKANGVWQRPTPLFDLNTEFNESDICILSDNTLIFASDRPGGMGGLDLYYSYNDQRNNEKREIEKPELTILTQTNIIQAERIVNSTIYHFPIIIPIKAFELAKSHAFSKYIFKSINVLAERINSNPIAFLQITNSSYNSEIEDIFKLHKISKDRYKFIDSNNKYIFFKSNSEELFDYIEINESAVSLKPPALDISINSRNSQSLEEFDIYFNIDNTISGIDLRVDSLPVRFIYDIEPFANKIYNSDSISILITYNYSTKRDSLTKVLQIVKSETKSAIKKNNSNKYIDFLMYLPANTDLSYWATTNKNYLEKIGEESDISKKLILFYYNKESQDQAKKITYSIIKSKKYIETSLAPIDNFIMPEESKNFFILRIEKY